MKYMKKTILTVLAAILIAALLFTGCSQKPAEAETPAPPEASAPAPAEELPAAEAVSPSPEGSSGETASPSPGTSADASQFEDESFDFLSMAGQKTYDDIVAEFGGSDVQNDSKVDDIDTRAVYYRNNTMWFKKDGDKWILDGTTIFRPSSPYTVSGVKVTTPTDEAVSKLEADGYEFVDGEPLEATNENLSIYQKKDADGNLITVQLVDSPDDNMISQIAIFSGRDVYQIPTDSLEPGGE